MTIDEKVDSILETVRQIHEALVPRTTVQPRAAAASEEPPSGPMTVDQAEAYAAAFPTRTLKWDFDPRTRAVVAVFSIPDPMSIFGKPPIEVRRPIRD